MSTHALAGGLPEKNRSMDRFLGLVASALPAAVELLPEIAGTQPVPMLAEADRPDWWTEGTLPGVMAGKRPAR